MSPQAASRPMYCTSCGAVNATGALACGQCGTGSVARPVVAAASTRGSWWVVASVLAVLLAAVAPLLFILPWRSLMDTSDGATLVGDAAIGLLVGGAALVGGVFAARSTMEDARPGPWVLVGISAAIGLVLAILITGEAWRLAHTTITNGYVNGGDDMFFAAALLSLFALVGLGITMIPGGDRRERFVIAASAIGVLAGTALAAACAWTLLSAGELQAAAAARVRNETPNGALAMMVVSFVAAALLTRRSRA